MPVVPESLRQRKPIGTPFHAIHNGRKRRFVVSQCVCGKLEIVLLDDLKRGNSCGCRTVTATIARSTIHGKSRGSDIYNIWLRIIRRCTSRNPKRSKHYGARGIKMCDRWRNSFVAFMEDMGPRPSPRHSVDRYPDANGNYEPSNCRWATQKEQARNKRTNRILTWKGRSQCMADWADELCEKYARIYKRLSRGWSVDQVLQAATDRNKSAVELVNAAIESMTL